MEDVSVIKKAAEMNAEHLLTHFDCIADAPDAIPRLQRFILDLAVRGKLVPQDPNDEPVAELLKRIRVEKARLVKAGEIRNPKQVLVIDAGECFFSPPRGWEWKRLSEISRKIHYGFTASANKMADAVRLLRITDIQDNSVDWFSVPGCEIGEKALLQFKLKKGDILVARTGGTIGKSFLVQDVPVAVVFASYLIRVQGSHEIYDRYLKLFLESPIYWIQLHDGSRGAGQPNVNGQTLGKMLVSLPPLAEQHRIVAKVDELMTLCDRLEAARMEREATRARMATASLARLNTPDPDPATFQNHAAFALNNLTPLTTRPDQIKALRQTILNLAVRGKLVDQDPADEPASADGNALDDELPFESPKGWVWVQFSDVATFENGDRSKKYPKRAEYVSSGVPWINTGHIQPDGSLCQRTMNYITGEKFNSLGGGKIRQGDMLYCLRGATFGKTAFVEPFEKGAIASSLMIIRPGSWIDRRFTYFYLISSLGRDQLQRFDNGTAQPNLSSASVKKYLLPLPPLAEQHRIVAKVDELMTLCDRLEASLATGDETRRRLLEILLCEAIEPDENRSL